MKEIKFRVWYKNTMIYNLDPRETHIENKEDCIVMQNTGLLDKNGKEIYEGDILEIGQETRVICDAVGSNGNGVKKYQEVGFYNGCFMTRNIEALGRWIFDNYLWIIHNSCIVTGNIYENPELLK